MWCLRSSLQCSTKLGHSKWYILLSLYDDDIKIINKRALKNDINFSACKFYHKYISRKTLVFIRLPENSARERESGIKCFFLFK